RMLRCQFWAKSIRAQGALLREIGASRAFPDAHEVQVLVVGTEVAERIDLGHGQRGGLVALRWMEIQPGVGVHAVPAPVHQVALAEAHHVAIEPWRLGDGEMYATVFLAQREIAQPWIAIAPRPRRQRGRRDERGLRGVRRGGALAGPLV